MRWCPSPQLLWLWVEQMNGTPHPTPPCGVTPSPLQLVVGRRVLGGDVGQVAEDLAAVDGQAGEQQQLLPGGTQQAGVVLDGKLAEKGQSLHPGDLPEEQLICQPAEQGEELHLRHLVSVKRGQLGQHHQLQALAGGRGSTDTPHGVRQSTSRTGGWSKEKNSEMKDRRKIDIRQESVPD